MEEVVKSFRKSGFSVEVISYPRDRRSVDVVAISDSEKVLIKVSYDARDVSRVEAEDLSRAEKAYGVSTAVVAARSGKSELEDDVVYFKGSMKIVTPKTLRKYLDGEKPIVASIHGTYVVKINPEMFRKKRTEHGYSRGELARLLNASTKTIYMYELGEMHASLDKAIMLATLLGEDIFEGFTLRTRLEDEKIRKPCAPRDPVEEAIYSIASMLSHEFLNFEKMPVDAVVKGKAITVSVVKSEAHAKDKVENAEKIASRVGAELFVIREPGDILVLKKMLTSRA